MKADLAELPVIMSNINIKTAKELDQIWCAAGKLELKTPQSFRNLEALKSVFKKGCPNLRISCDQIEKLPCLPVSINEVLYYAFPDEVDCVNSECLQILEE